MMAEQPGRYPNRLRACIKEAGSTMRKVSEATGIAEVTLVHWVFGTSVIPHHSLLVLSQLLGCPVEALVSQPPASSPYDGVVGNPGETSPLTVCGREAMDQLRRCLLRYAPMLGSAAIFSPLSLLDEQEQERISRVLVAPGRLDQATLDGFEFIGASYWQMYRHRSFASSQLLGYAVGHLEQAVQVGRASLPVAYQQRMGEIIADAAHLVGYIAWDRFMAREATDAAYTLALQAAQESGATVTQAMVLGHMSWMRLCGEKPPEGLPLIEQAKQLVTKAGTPAALRAWIAAIAAQMEAAMHEVKVGSEWEAASLRDMDEAQQLIGTTAPDDTNLIWLHTGFDVSKLAGYLGACCLRLDHTEEAREACTHSLAMASLTGSGSKPDALSWLATVHAQCGEVEAACSVAQEALNMIQPSIGAPHALRRVRALRRQLEPATTTPAVRRLDEHLALF